MKLEVLVGDAIDKGCDTLVTIGAIQSNHTRQTPAVHAYANNFEEVDLKPISLD